jgi:prepilin-type processing-associated H-X9-DG protein
MVELLPFVEHDDLFRKMNLKESWESKHNDSSAKTNVRLLMCPSIEYADPERLPGMTSYLGITGIEPGAATLPLDSPKAGLYGYDRVVKKVDIKDERGSTLMIMETGFDIGPWAAGGLSTLRGIDQNQQPYLGKNRSFGGNHFAEKEWFSTPPSLANAAFADGSVKTLKDTIDPGVLEALATIAGGEQVPGDF